MHSRRLITGFASLPVLLLGIFWQYGDWLTAAVVALCFVGGRDELVSLLQGSRSLRLAFWQNALAAAFFFAVVMGWNTALVVIAFLFFWGSCSITMRDGVERSRNEIGVHGLVLIYLLLPLASIVYLRRLECGPDFLFFILVVSCITDSGAYYGGKLLGRHKLAPRISPKKTWEGSVCGTGLTLVIVFLTAAYQSAYIGRTLWLPDAYRYIPILGIALVMSVIGQVGDLCESAMKRDANVKDSGSSLTGHGGFLDMMDAILWIAPAMMVYLAIWMKQ